MSLATRCPACQTVFRVVQDQLRVSEGWVRCGRCNEVFNAVEHMVDMARPAPMPEPEADTPAHAPEISAESWVRDDFAPQVAAPMPEPEPVADASVHDEPEPAPAPVDVDEAAPPPAVQDTPQPEPGIEPRWAVDAPAAADEAVTEPASTLPTFVQAADRAARWQRSGVRRSLFAAAALALMVLSLQVAIEYRDLVAARWTATRPALEALCRWSGCRIEPPRWIDALAVDSSGLVRIEGTQTYRFSVTLHNRAAMALALPSIDLTLTDAQGRVIARRAFLAADLGSTASTVAAGAELPLQATLSIIDRPVAGYTIEIFYP